MSRVDDETGPPAPQHYNLGAKVEEFSFTSSLLIGCRRHPHRYLRHLLAFIFAIEEINNRTDLLPNITLGFQVYDTCNREHEAVQSVLDVLSGSEDPIPNVDCHKKSTVFGFLGHRTISSSLASAALTGVYQYPQISYGAMNPSFYSKFQFPSFDSTVPDVKDQFIAIILLLKHFGWNWVGIVSLDNEDDEFSCVPESIEKESYDKACRESYSFRSVDPSRYDVEHFRYTFSVYSAVYALAYALHDTPRSLCSESCLPGYQKLQHEGGQPCCHHCVPCPENEITNKNNMERCYKCPEDQWPNERRDTCMQRTIDFLSYGDTLGVSLMFMALLFCFGTIIMFGIFVKHKDTPIVKANNRTFSFIFLISLILSFLCPLLFIGRPTKIFCLLRQAFFGTIFSVAVSSVLAKTVTVVLAFNVTRPNSINKWMKKQFSVFLLIICSSGQLVICVFWFVFSPPFQEYDTQVEVGKMILQCNEGSVTAFYILIGYMGCLAVFSFIVAFLARKLPDTFNEAQYITFSMLVFCSVWISFIPAYLSTKGRYMVAVEVLFSSAGLLGCIFIPKCYIILMRPELNAKATVAQRKALQ
ncbi:PREDICTED: vomeronasal type-2 receptor 116-like [Nanorana parkeri]|uniref:vomeronasal type-2 receptor 116-like n=1 Tax=Nanorana parkeri TaxID=125878 RepID=UPI000854ECB9|nr:PREDICTED: vomeronasal type-2 receptor 116-like [Nanorana parkeri]